MTLTADERRIFVALDRPDLEWVYDITLKLLGKKVRYKVGLELCTEVGVPSALNAIGGGQSGFLDLKFGDIPNTVAGAVRAAAKKGVGMLNVHCSGGEAMMKAAVEARDKVCEEFGWYTDILGVTVLTSHNETSLALVGIDPRRSIEGIVQQLALLAQKLGLDGVVCSPKEIAAVRQVIPDPEFKIVTPGIRDKGAPADDQKRTLTAGEAIHLGATHLVIGRPITAAADPVAAADKFIAEINEARAAKV